MPCRLSIRSVRRLRQPLYAPQGQSRSGDRHEDSGTDQVNKLTTAEYFDLLASLMKDNPPTAANHVARVAKIGIVPGKKFNAWRVNAATVKSLDSVPKEAFEAIAEDMGTLGKRENGWSSTPQPALRDRLSRSGHDYRLWSGGQSPAGCRIRQADADGKPYSGANRSVMHFPKGEQPPARFWSLTMYNAEYFFVDNPLNKYTVSPRNDLKYNDDGSLTLYRTSRPAKTKKRTGCPRTQRQIRADAANVLAGKASR